MAKSQPNPPTSTLAPTVSTLVLYDTTGPWGFLGELYAIAAGNLASHFGSWTAMPVSSYTSGLIGQHTATIYIGSTYEEPIPAAFFNDVFATNRPVIWIFYNIWLLTQTFGTSFSANYGWTWGGFDNSTVGEVQYKGQNLKRYSANANGFGGVAITNPSAVSILAQCVRADGSTFPWAVRSSLAGSGGSLTYVTENPFAYISEGDRYLAFCDLLFDALAPSTVERHRATVRLEDIDPTFDPATLRAVADYLASQNVPFGFQIIPFYTDPLGTYNNGVQQKIPLRQSPDVVSALKYMQSKGGVMMLHGYTHQYSNVPNPFDAVTGDDCEFFRITANPDQTLNYLGPVAQDSTSWATNRFVAAGNELVRAGMTTTTIPLPQFHTFPSYAASAIDYFAAQSVFGKYYGSNFTRAERALYFSGLLTPNGPIDNTRFIGQYMPYTVRDVYGSRVLADTLGGIDPDPNSRGFRLPADIIADAQRTLVVRDGVAAFFWHTYDDIQQLKDSVTGLKQLGYTFVPLTTL